MHHAADRIRNVALVGHRGVRLSGGQVQRLALARALACDADLLLADDVSSALDATTEVELWTALRELAGLPERLRRLPETARGHGEDVRRLTEDLRTPGRRLVGVPIALWRLREVSELVRPHAAVLPFLSTWFLTLSAIAAFAAVAEIVIALVLLIAALV